MESDDCDAGDRAGAGAIEQAAASDFPAAGSGCDGVEDRHKSPAATMGGGLSTR